MKFRLASLNIFTNFKDCSKAASNFFPFLGSHWSNFSCVYSWLALKQFSGSQAAFGTTIKVTGGYWKAGIRSLKRITAEPLLLNVYGAPALIPRNEFRQPM
jgi:hypothetical protein